MRNANRRWLLRRYPEAMPSAADFELVEGAIPEPAAGQVLARLLYLSIDPYMRGRITGQKGYTRGVEPGEVMVGGAVGEVVRSEHPRFKPGDRVESMGFGWQDYAVLAGDGLRKLAPDFAPLTHALGLLGMPGLTAYFGLLELGQPKPGETVLVSAAAGAVGQVVGQIARIGGCRTVAVAGSPEKLAWCRELGYDATIDYKTAGDLKRAVREACPDGVHVFFDNVGGALHDAAMANLATHARIVVCGSISGYNRIGQPDMGERHLRTMIVARAIMRGLLVTDFFHRAEEGYGALQRWRDAGKLRYREDVAQGLENAPAILARVLSGGNFGKQAIAA